MYPLEVGVQAQLPPVQMLLRQSMPESHELPVPLGTHVPQPGENPQHRPEQQSLLDRHCALAKVGMHSHSPPSSTPPSVNSMVEQQVPAIAMVPGAPQHAQARVSTPTASQR